MARQNGIASSDVTFAEATPEQRQVVLERCSKLWDKPLASDDYIEREQQLANHDLTKDRRKCWVLYVEGHPLDIVASCEGTRKAVIVSGGEGSARGGYGYTLTNLYVNPAYHRPGIVGTSLLLRVQLEIDKDSDCSVLYADNVNYSSTSVGWHPFPSRQARLILRRMPTGPYQAAKTLSLQNRRGSPFTATRPLQPSDLPALCQQDTLQLVKSLTCLPADGNTHVAFLPNNPHITYQLDRAAWDAYALYPPTPNGPLVQGAVTADGESWTYWAHDWRTKRLRVLRVVTSESGDKQQRAADMAGLLTAAVAEAQAWRLGKVVVWDVDDEIAAACEEVMNYEASDDSPFAPGGRVRKLEIEVAEGAMRWKGVVLSGRKCNGIVWEQKQGYCWC